MISNKLKATVVLGGFFGVLILGALLGWAPYAEAQTATSTDGRRIIPAGSLKAEAVCNEPGVPWLEWKIISQDGSTLPYQWQTNTNEIGYGEVMRGETVVIETGRSKIPGDTVFSVSWGGSRAGQLGARMAVNEDTDCFPREDSSTKRPKQPSPEPVQDEQEILTLQQRVIELLMQILAILKAR